ncbi:hypothetical protein N7G274_006941 [Stereocaulon virgatum]|uniref:U-box domain-containing protein n=1 Tax=Stereocaulon virgatum TaxID=373712 RepID=A0ABR4A498_9LECA
MSHKAVALKEEGNKYFQDGDYKEAESLYSQAIQKDSTNPKIFTNRAMARLKLQSWDACVDDCIKAIELDHGSMKGYYYLAQAQLALNHPNEAFSSALTAYERCIETFDNSATAVSNLVLQAKKQKWEARERERIRGRSELLRELEDGLMKRKKEDLQRLKFKTLDFSEEAEEKADIELECRKKIEELRNIFAVADPKNMQRREVPDYLIDNISFTVMHDPVVTKTGNSYDRATVMEHLKRSHTDPLTREPLHMQDLRPNLALRQACEQFLTENGWAVDW